MGFWITCRSVVRLFWVLSALDVERKTAFFVERRISWMG
jgi:hypothetical protein